MSNKQMTEVYLEEEYGYREWRFTFFGNQVELEDWWSNLKSVHSFWMDPAGTIEKLGVGTMEQVRDYDDPLFEEWTIMIHLHQDDDSFLLILEDMRWVKHAGFEE